MIKNKSNKEKFLVVVITLTRWKAWFISLHCSNKDEIAYLHSNEIDRKVWTNEVLYDNERMLATFNIDKNLYQTEVHFLSWTKVKTFFPELIPEKVLKKYKLKI